MEVILTHTNADFDAVAALLAAHKLNPEAIPVLPEYLRRNVYKFVTLYQSGLPFVRWEDFRPKNVTRLILVDTQRIPSLRRVKQNTPVHIIDHHPPQEELLPHQTIHYELLGATTTLLVEELQEQGIALDSLEATLLTLGIYEDTGSLTYRATTPRDIRAAAWLVEQNAALDKVRRFLSPPMNEEQQTLYEHLLKTLDSRIIQGYTITVAAAKIDEYLPELNQIAHQLRDTIHPAAIFLLVQMPKSLQLICRGTNEAVDVGEIARYFGGGGHTNAAAAAIRHLSLDEATDQLWQQLYQLVRPIARVADLMSFGVQTVTPDQRIADLIQQMRRIGHEGFPVIEQGRVVGLLTRREVDRATEHGLGKLTVREIMSTGEIMLSPDDSVSTLEQTLVESGWGQIPVVDDRGQLIGIVTRTDLIKHWAEKHPNIPTSPNTIPPNQIEEVLGQAAAKFIHAIAEHAQKLDLNVYLVGGAVRDLLLHRRNLDIDFVVEGNAVELANSLCNQLGGRVKTHRPFGTAKWLFDGEVADKLHVSIEDLPNHVDFATSRNEFYDHPTALPTVYNSSVKLDLQRRDFTINTLAIQISPAAAMWRILDFYGGLHDLDKRLIRVLHSLSFVDDPTRILRAVRFEQRLDFQIEPRTEELIDTALPMLRRITGKRLYNELNLMLNEPEPEQGLLKLHQRGITQAIHPAFVIDERIHHYFALVRSYTPPWKMATPDPNPLYWHVLACTIPVNQLPDWSDRLLIGREESLSLLQAAQIVQNSAILKAIDSQPSEIVQHLHHCSELALLAAWIMLDNVLVRQRIQTYMLAWRHVHPTTTGHTLREIGLEAGPRYKVILEQLRDARLDGVVSTDDEEQALLHRLITETNCDDSP